MFGCLMTQLLQSLDSGTILGLSGAPVAPIVSGNDAGARCNRFASIPDRFPGLTPPRELFGAIFDGFPTKSLVERYIRDHQ